MIGRALLLFPTRSTAWRYGIAAVAAVAAVAVQAWLPAEFSRELPLLLPGIAVFLSAFLGGAGPGLLATVLGAAGATLLFLEPSRTFAVAYGTDQVRLLAFVILGSLLSLVTGALHSSRRRVASILSNITDCYFAVDRDWRVVEMNDRAAAYFHRPRAQMIGHVFWDVLPQCLGSDLHRGAEQAIREHAPVHFETHSCIRADEWAEYHLYPSGRHIQCYFRDISARKTAEESLRRRERQLAVLSRTSQSINAVLEIPVILRTLVASGMELVEAAAGTGGLMVEGQLHFSEYNEHGRIRPADQWFAPGEGVPGHVFQTRQPYLTNDAEHDPYVVPEFRRRLGFYNLINVPIIGRDGQVLGCFEMHNKRDRRPFDADDVAMLQGLAASAAIALENARGLDDLRRAEESLRVIEERWRLAVESATLGTWDFCPLTGRLDWSNQLKAIFGLSQDMALSYDLFVSRIHPEDRAHAEAVICQGMDPTGPGEYEDDFRIILPDGAVRWISARGRTFFDEEGPGGTRRATRMIGTALDITARKDAEEQLRLSEERLRLATESADIGTWDFDAVTGAVTWSPRAKEIFGLPPDAPVSYDLFVAMVHPQDRDAAIQAAEKALDPAGTGEYHGEFRIIRERDGAVRWITGRGRAFFAQAPDGTRHAIRLIGTTLDITDRKRSEEVLVEAKQQAETANQAKDQFLATLSHELRTPLTPVLASASSMQEDRRLDPDVREHLGMIRRNVDLEARLIDDLLDLTRIARGKIELAHEVVDIHRAILDAVSMSASDGAASDKQLDIVTHTDAQAHHAWADPARIRQVLWNLVKNAVKFTPPGGRITIRTSNPAPHRIRVQVSDTGIGIERDALDRIFNAFQQADRSVTRRFGGLGLGLAICKAIVDLHGGTIRAESAGRGKGSTFTVELPTSVPAPAAAPAPPAHAPAAARTSAEGKLRILLVEDHPDTARVVGHLLKRQGYDVRTAGDVSTALNLARHEPFDVIISDLGLPDGSGLDLMRQIRTIHRHIRGIALSGYGMAEDIHASHDAGFAEHLVKPIDIRRLREAIDHLPVG